MHTTTLPAISPIAKAILQRLNRGQLLTYTKEDESWRINGQDETKHDRAIRELVHLACVETMSDVGFRKTFRISSEGQRILAIPGYEPIIRKARVRH